MASLTTCEDKPGIPVVEAQSGSGSNAGTGGGLCAAQNGQPTGVGGQDSGPPAWCRVLPAVLLILQSVAFSMTFRVARRQGSGFSNIAMVIASEVVKMLGSTLAIAIISGPNGMVTSLQKLFMKEVRQTLKMCVPGCLYLVQNFLFFIAITNLSICMFEVTKQLNVLTTSITWIVILGKRIDCPKWIALLLVLLGVCTITWQGDKSTKGNFVLGIACILVACFLSSLASVFMESMLQKEVFSLWENNVVLAFFGIFFGVGVLVVNELADVMENGFTYGFTSWVWGGVVLQALGGILTAAVLKYLDSVTKVVSKATSVVLSSACSRILLQEGPRLGSPNVAFGMAMTLGGICLYGLGLDWLINLGGLGALPEKVSESCKAKAASKSHAVEAETVGLMKVEDEHAMSMEGIGDEDIHRDIGQLTKHRVFEAPVDPTPVAVVASGIPTFGQSQAEGDDADISDHRSIEV